MASNKILLMYLTIGASSSEDVDVPESFLLGSSSPPVISRFSRSSSRPSIILLLLPSSIFSISLTSRSSSTMTVSTLSPVLKRMASMASRRVGSPIATNKRLPRLKIGSALYCLTIFSSICSLGISSKSNASKSNKGSPNSSAISHATWADLAILFLTR